MEDVESRLSLAAKYTELRDRDSSFSPCSSVTLCAGVVTVSPDQAWEYDSKIVPKCAERPVLTPTTTQKIISEEHDAHTTHRTPDSCCKVPESRGHHRPTSAGKCDSLIFIGGSGGSLVPPVSHTTTKNLSKVKADT